MKLQSTWGAIGNAISHGKKSDGGTGRGSYNATAGMGSRKDVFEWDENTDGKTRRPSRSNDVMQPPKDYRIPKVRRESQSDDVLVDELLEHDGGGGRSLPGVAASSTAAPAGLSDRRGGNRQPSWQRSHGVWPGTPPPPSRSLLTAGPRSRQSSSRLQESGHARQPVVLEHDLVPDQPSASKSFTFGTKRQKLELGREGAVAVAQTRRKVEPSRRIKLPVKGVNIGATNLGSCMLHISPAEISALSDKQPALGEVYIKPETARGVLFNGLFMTLRLEGPAVKRLGRRNDKEPADWGEESYAPFSDDPRFKFVRLVLHSTEDLEKLLRACPFLKENKVDDEIPDEIPVTSSRGRSQQQAALAQAESANRARREPAVRQFSRTNSSQAATRSDGPSLRPTSATTNASSSSAAAFKPPRSSQRLRESNQARRTPIHTKVLVYPDESAKDAITLTNDELNRLERGEFLNDTLVDFYLKYLQKTMAEKDGGSEKLERYHFFNSFFYKRLLQTMGEGRNNEEKRKQYKSVRRWTKGTDIFNKDYLFVPINESLHWSLIIIVRPGDFVSSSQKRQEEEQQRRLEEESDRDTDVDDESNLWEDTQNLGGVDQEHQPTGSDAHRAEEYGSDDDVHDEEVEEPSGEVRNDRGRGAEVDTEIVLSSPGFLSEDEQMESGFGSEEDAATAQAAGHEAASASKAGQPQMERSAHTRLAMSQMPVVVDDLNESDDDDSLVRSSEPFEGGGGGARASPIEIDEPLAGASNDASDSCSKLAALVHCSPNAAVTSSDAEAGAPFMPSSGKLSRAAIHGAATPSSSAGLDPGAGVLSQPVIDESSAPPLSPCAHRASPPSAWTLSQRGRPEQTDEQDDGRARLPASMKDESASMPTSCMLYLDSLGGSKSRAFRLLADYLYEEWAEKKRGHRARSAPPVANTRSADRSTTEPDQGTPRGVHRSSAQPQRPSLEQCSPDPLPPGHSHFFRDMPHKEVRVPEQHNHCDCGLYMLKYIELFAEHAPTLSPPLEEARKPEWRAYHELRFGSPHIDDMRKQMAKIIEELGQRQRLK